ncbi:MAG: peptidase E [Roseburia sp.]
MGRIVAIGGGDLQTTKELNQYMIKSSKKEHPNVLFIGTASGDAEGYIEGIKEAFGILGCQVKALRLVTEQPSEAEIDTLLAWADIIYVGGGDTASMMKKWKEYGIDSKLLAIYKNDTAVLGGLSAGAICWFDCGHSDREAFSGKEDWNYIFVEGMLGIHSFALCPHYNEEGRSTFDVMMREKQLPGLALENETAFVEENGVISFIRSRKDAKAYKITYHNGEMTKSEVVFGEIG